MECLLLFLVLSETYEKGANELHREAALQDLNGQSDTGTNACMKDNLISALDDWEHGTIENVYVPHISGCIDSSNVGQTSSGMDFCIHV